MGKEVPADIALKRGDVDMIALMDPDKVAFLSSFLSSFDRSREFDSILD
jgi:hypothetical protein